MDILIRLSVCLSVVALYFVRVCASVIVRWSGFNEIMQGIVHGKMSWRRVRHTEGGAAV